MRVTQVDLDALDIAAALLRGQGLYGAARKVDAAIAELRELRELVGCATEFRIGRCKIVKSDESWDLWSPREIGRLYNTIPEALAAARTWEAENA